ncbi:peptidase S8/S53 domain-containing protein [Lactarius quietus]|nr:peptidase S8/S53 domain-containing protein [Lactarius quietus]
MYYYGLSVLSCLSYHVWDDIRVKHTWNTVPSNWEILGPPPSNTTIDLHIGLLPQSENALIDALYEVSTPGHSKYGAHLSKEQVAQLVAPHRDTLDIINSWLKHHGIPRSTISVSHGGGWLTVAAVPVSQANEMLGASYQLYRQSGTNDTSIIRTISYTLPAVLHKHVRTVVPTTYFASTDTQWQSPQRHSLNATSDMASRELGTMLSSRGNTITPTDLRWLYRTSAYVPAATDKNAFGVVGYGNNYPSHVDLKNFMTKYRTDARDATYKTVEINGVRYNPSLPTNEANQNIQYAEAMVYPTPIAFYSVGGGKGDNMLEWLNHVLNQPDVPKTISISVLFASGNSGVGRDCKTDDGVQFVPEFPASCPYVTSVGGTTGGTEETRLGPEVAAKLSGGGFSNYFARPDYQKEAVLDFLKELGGQYAGMYNADGRALNYLFIKRAGLIRSSGTSFATPTPVGFLNPLLYGNLRPAMNDITSGSNPGCNTPGFSAIPGWDPVTGLGTPDFVDLQALRD